jgi:hypothetical protein
MSHCHPAVWLYGPVRPLGTGHSQNSGLPSAIPSGNECALILGMPCPLGQYPPLEIPLVSWGKLWAWKGIMMFCFQSWAPSHALTPKSLKCEAPPEFQRAATDQWGFGHEYLEHINVCCCNLKTIELDTVPIWIQNRKRSQFI